MPYGDNDFKDTNVNYINKDFATIKNSLIEYAQSYFPDTYRDFNETSPGMMLLEMSAYVGDVLSFYVDQQYREMLLPLAEERRNIVTLASMLGYKTRPVVPAHTYLTITQTVSAISDGTAPDYSTAVVIEKGMQVQASSDPDIKFETLEVTDFTVSSSRDSLPVGTNEDGDGVYQNYEIQRTVRAISGETITRNFSVGGPQKFFRIDLPEDNVIDVVSVVDSSQNRYYEVKFLAQDKVPLETHYTENDRETAYAALGGEYISPASTYATTMPVPYTLDYIRTDKRFIVEVDHNSVTSIVFGNGILRSGQTQQSMFYQTEQVGIGLPGKGEHLVSSIDPMLGDEYSTLGNTPSNTTLTVTYRVGGGITSNVSANELTTINTTAGAAGSPSVDAAVLTAKNLSPARGGSDAESVGEIKERASAFFSTQDRCVTKADYEARIMNMPSKFGNIAKVLVERSSTGNLEQLDSLNAAYQAMHIIHFEGGSYIGADLVEAFYQDHVEPLISAVQAGAPPTIDVYVLSYNNNKELTTTPSDPLGHNIKTYLSQYRMITDEIVLRLNRNEGGNGMMVNFGVYFDVVKHKYANAAEVKLKCIDKIRNYFSIDKMEYRQPLYISQLEYELMGIDGVRAVNYVCISQLDNYMAGLSPTGGYTGGVGATTTTFPHALYSYHHSDEVNEGNGGWVLDTSNTHGGSVVSDYGSKFDFSEAYEDGVIKPSLVPSVFELKNPDQNIKGAVH